MNILLCEVVPQNVYNILSRESPWAGYLAAAVKNQHSLQFINMGLPKTDSNGFIDSDASCTITDTQLIAKFKAFRPDAVGFSFYTGRKGEMRMAILARRFKSINPGCKIILGGNHASFMYHELLKNKSYDYVIVGEGDNSFPELIDSIEADRDISRIKGLAYRENKKIKFTGLRKPISDLDSLPFPERKIYPRTKYREENIINCLVCSARGCPYGRCSFCPIAAFYGSSHFACRSPANIMDEIEDAQKIYGKDFHIYFLDEFILSRLDKIIAEKVKRGLDFTFRIDARVDTICDFSKNIALGKKHGLEVVLVGVENFCDRILKLYNKGITAKQNFSALKILNMNDITANLHMIPFSPWIKPIELVFNQRILLNYAFYRKFGSFTYDTALIFNPLRFYPGTPFFKLYGPDLAYVHEPVACALESILSVKGIAGVYQQRFFKLSKITQLALLHLIIHALRGDEHAISADQKWLETFLRKPDKAIQSKRWNSEKFAVIDKRITPVFYSIYDYTLFGPEDIEEPSNEFLFIPKDQTCLANAERKTIIPLTKKQALAIEYLLLGLNIKEVVKQLEYEGISVNKEPIQDCAKLLKAEGCKCTV